MNKRLIIAVGLAVGLPMINARAGFTGYYRIDTGMPGEQVFLPPTPSPFTMNNWTLRSDGKSTVTFTKAPPFPSPVVAEGFTVDVQAGGGRANFEIYAPPVGTLGVVGAYYFTYNAAAAIQGGNSAGWYDFNGSHPITTQVGSGWFTAPLGSAGLDPFGFYVKNGGSATAVLNIQLWAPVPEPSAIAMGLITCLGTMGFVVRRYRSRKS